MSAARPWLRSLRSARRDLRRRGDDHPALARRQLLVGVEGEGRPGGRARRPGRPRSRRRRAPRRRPRACPRPRFGGQRLELRHRRRVAEDVDRQQPDGALGRPRRGRGRVEVEGHRVDVAEDRRRALVQQAVGRGDEAERGRDDLVARAPAERPDAEVERGGAARRPRPRRRPRASRRSRARSAPASAPARAARSAAPRAPAPPRARPARGGRAGSARVAHEGVGARWAAGSTACSSPRRFRGWNAYSSESTSASHDASMMFSETPIEPQDSLPVGGVEQDARDRAGAVVRVEDPDLVVDQLDVGQVRVQLGDRVAQRPVERVDRARCPRRCARSAGRRPRS